MSSPSKRITNHLYKGRGQGHVTHFKFWDLDVICGTAEARIISFYTHILAYMNE